MYICKEGSTYVWLLVIKQYIFLSKSWSLLSTHTIANNLFLRDVYIFFLSFFNEKVYIPILYLKFYIENWLSYNPRLLRIINNGLNVQVTQCDIRIRICTYLLFLLFVFPPSFSISLIDYYVCNWSINIVFFIEYI